MEGTESLVEVPEVCRLCMDDLADATEYFSIDEDLHALVEALTGISVCLALKNLIRNPQKCPFSWI